MPEPLTLQNNPREALSIIADFIDAIELTNHEHPTGVDKRACEGWWQPVDFFYQLQNIAHEARRVAGQSSIPSFKSVTTELCLTKKEQHRV